MGHGIGALKPAVHPPKALAAAGAAGGYAPTTRTNGPTRTPHGISRKTPGVGEQMQQAMQSRLVGPSALGQATPGLVAGLSGPTNAQGVQNSLGSAMQNPSQAGQYFNGIQGQFQNPNLSSNNAQSQYNSYLGQVPQNLNPYYDQAAKKTSSRLNNQFGARGQFNSSAATDSIGQAMASLGAEQANREADYGLQRAQLGGNLASSADASSRGQLQGKLAAQLGGGQLASSADQSDVARILGAGQLASNADRSNIAGALGAGQLLNTADQSDMSHIGMAGDQAFTAQGAREDRLQTMLQNIMGMGQGAGALAMNNFQGMSQTDMALLDAILSGKLAQTNQGVQDQRYGDEQVMNLAGGVFDGYGTFSGGGKPTPTRKDIIDPWNK